MTKKQTRAGEASQAGSLGSVLTAPAALLTVAASSAASGLLASPIPTAAALLAWVLYALLLRSSSFRRWSRRNFDEQLKLGNGSEVETLLEGLAESQREHYYALRELRDQILSNYQKLPGGSVVAAASESQVDALLTSFLRLLSTLNAYRQYMTMSDRKTIEAERASLTKEIAGETNERLAEVKKKRVEILEKRVARFAQAEEGRELVSHQLAGIEDLLRLTHEQSIAIRDPETLSKQLDVLTAEVHSTEETVREMEQFLEFTDELHPIPHGPRVRT